MGARTGAGGVRTQGGVEDEITSKLVVTTDVKYVHLKFSSP